MMVEMLTESVGQFGYFALFFTLWLGIVGMPIPDEVIVLSAGVLTSMNILEILPAFIATYLGVVSGLSLGYVLGRMLGAPALNWIGRKNGNGQIRAAGAVSFGEIRELCAVHQLFFAGSPTCCPLSRGNRKNDVSPLCGFFLYDRACMDLDPVFCRTLHGKQCSESECIPKHVQPRLGSRNCGFGARGGCKYIWI